MKPSGIFCGVCHRQVPVAGYQTTMRGLIRAMVKQGWGCRQTTADTCPECVTKQQKDKT